MTRVLIFATTLVAGAGLAVQSTDARPLQNPEPEEQGSAAVAGVQVTAAADMWTG